MLFCIAAVLSLGCGVKLPIGMPKLYPVKVTFLYDDGTPVANAQVQLIRDEPLPLDWFIKGTTDDKGRLDATIYGRFDGIPEGFYTAEVRKLSEDPSVFGDTPPNDPDEEMLWAAKRGTEVRGIYREIQEEFSSAETSTCTFDVEKGGGKFTVYVGEKVKDLIGETEASGLDPEEITPESLYED